MHSFESFITRVSYHFYRLILLCMGIIGILGLVWAFALASYGLEQLEPIRVAKAVLLFILAGLLSSGAWDILRRLPDQWEAVKK